LSLLRSSGQNPYRTGSAPLLPAWSRGPQSQPDSRSRSLGAQTGRLKTPRFRRTENRRDGRGHGVSSLRSNASRPANALNPIRQSAEAFSTVQWFGTPWHGQYSVPSAVPDATATPHPNVVQRFE